MKQSHVFWLVWLLLHLPMAAWTQTISGRVSDAESGAALAAANVYLPTLQVGVLTDAEGRFAFAQSYRGEFMMQVSHLGYETAFLRVTAGERDSVLDIRLRPSMIELQEVQVLGLQPHSPRESPRTVDALSQADMRQNGALSLSDGLSRLPGMSQLSSGVGISKPVVRGLFGNRVQVNVMGLRFDNQQWQDEHGMGLSDAGVDRVEVIKGATGLLYGSEAIGGVVNVIEEKPAPVDSTRQDLNLKLMSNTFGTGLDYGWRRSKQDRWWRVRAALENHGDYSSAGNVRALNSRFANYNLKFSRGIRKEHHLNTLNAFLSMGQFGFVFDSISRMAVDGRLSRSYAGPHHTVIFGLVSTENIYFRGRDQFRLNAGWVVNQRQEQEGGNKVSLNMLLNTGSATGQWIKPLGAGFSLTSGIALLAQHNLNIGSRTIVPDAVLAEGGLYSMVEAHRSKIHLQGGLRYDRREIATFETGTINGPGKDVQPFHKGRNAFNGSIGFAWNPWEALGFHGHVSSGYRSGNLAELSSNGLHEGTARWEIGNPDLKVEQNLCAELGTFAEIREWASLRATAFWNGFRNYIYLAPTGLEYFGFNIHNYVQSDATLKGAELSLDIHPGFLRHLDLRADFTHLRADRADGGYLPFIPANKANATLRWLPKAGSKSPIDFVSVGGTYVLAQDRPAEFELATPAYFLMQAGAGGHVHFLHQGLQITLLCNNLLDAKYVDHLSRYRYYGIYNMGRNVVANLNLAF